MVRPASLLRSCVFAAVLLAGTGCLRAHNPTYFPNLGFGGDVERTHAKPAGRAYFKNYDPKAVRLEVTPTKCSNPVGKQQVLIATVYDADGQPRRSRRVEWIIDGPGYIVEVDESGWLPGRGYKVDNKYAVSHTDYREHTITRGNDDPRDDFTVAPGQTWCVVSSAVEGQTAVTAYAPEVYDWDNGRVTTKLQWADAQFAFPPPVISRSGGEAELTTTLHRFNEADNPDGLKVRYRVLGGAPAVIVTKTGKGTSASQQGGLSEAEVPTDADGAAAVRIAQPSPQAGQTRVAVEVVKPDKDGLGSGTVIGSKETVVEWASPDLTLDVKAATAVPLDAETPLSVVLSNAGKADSSASTIRLTLPDAAKFVRAAPPPTVVQGRELTWNLGAVAAGKTQQVDVSIRPTKLGAITILTSAETTTGLRAEQQTRVEVGKGGIRLSAEAPGTASLGEPVVLQVGVTNTGTVPLQNATAWVAADAGLAPEGGEATTEVAVGVVPPGETKTVDVQLFAKQTGRFAVRVNATADGGLSDRVQTAVEVKKTSLAVAVTGPERMTLKQDAVWEVRVTNTGETPVEGGVARVSVPQSLEAKSASDGGTVVSRDAVEWPLGTLRPGERKSVRFTASGADITSRAVLIATVTAGTGLTARADATVAVGGQPAVSLEMSNAPTLTVGQRTPVRITVRNRGSSPAQNVEVAVTVTGELTAVGGEGADRKAAKLAGDRITFPTLAELPVGSAAVFIADVEGAKTGSARISTEVRAAHLRQPLREEQPARVTGK